MTSSFWLKAQAVVSGLFGIGFLIAPASLGTAYAAGVNPTTELALRYLGAVLLSVAVIAWMASSAERSALRLWVIRSGALYGVLGIALAFLGMSNGVMTSLGWLNVLLGGLFLVTFGYFGFVRTDG
jgi:hypothetical protein